MRPSIRPTAAHQLHERLDGLLSDPAIRPPLLVGLVMRFRRVRPVLHPFHDLTDSGPSPVQFCWRAVGLLVEVDVAGQGASHSGRILHMVGRDERRITRLALDGGPPVSAFDGQGSLDDLCERLLGISGPPARPEASP